MFNERDHPRDKGGKFTEKSAGELKSALMQELPAREKIVQAIQRYSDDPARDIEKIGAKAKNPRMKVGEITNPIYDNMVLSNGYSVKDIVTRAVEIPLYGSVGVEHIENHKERRGMVEHYIGFMNDIINDPDYVFEDKRRENTIVIEKEVDEHTVMVVSLNFDNPDYTNTVITMRGEGKKRFKREKKEYEKLKKVLYKRENA